MKKLLGLFIIAGLVSFGACKQNAEEQAEKEKLQHELDSIKQAQIEQQKMDSIAKVQKERDDSIARVMEKLEKEKAAAQAKAAKAVKKEEPKSQRKVEPAPEQRKVVKPGEGRNA